VEGYESSSYGDAFADVYDRWYAEVTDVEACVERLRTLTPAGGRVLELGVGTGRLAVPLAAAVAGIDARVTGVDTSTVMLDGLRAKPGGDRVALVLGDMADLGSADPPVPDEPGFDLAFVAYNTLFNLTAPEDAARCIDGVARRLAPGGRFAVEAFVPRPDPDGRRDGVAVSRMAATELVLTATVHDPDAQTITGQHVQITEAGVRLRPWMVRYRHPAEIDDLASRAGLVLEHRWADWSGAAFDEHSPAHVSVYRRPP
jgi:SAM-dependent methyltransferase